MRHLSAADAQRWCARSGLHLPVDHEGVKSALLTGDDVFTFRTPIEGLRIVDLANWLLTLDDGGDFLQADRALIWLLDWDIWSVERERVGLCLLGSTLGMSDLASAPAIEFYRDELAKAQSMLALVALFQWDALVLPSHAEYVVRLSHHGSAEVVARTPDLRLVLAEGVERFEQGGPHSR